MTVMDDHWLEQCREGEYARHRKNSSACQKDVYRLAFSILDNADEADDGTQEAFLAALHTLKSFHENAAFKTWLFGCHN